MGNWNKLLKEKYDIESFPHHVLIDKHGKIILNKCQRPEAGAEQEIRKSLANWNSANQSNECWYHSHNKTLSVMSININDLLNGV